MDTHPALTAAHKAQKKAKARYGKALRLFNNDYGPDPRGTELETAYQTACDRVLAEWKAAGCPA